MTKFEQVGVNLQNDSVTKEEARKNFAYSCRVCCNRGMQIHCDRCAISVCHQQTMACLNDLAKMNKKKQDKRDRIQ